MIHLYKPSDKSIVQSIDVSNLSQTDLSIKLQLITLKASELDLNVYNDSDTTKKIVNGILTDKTEGELIIEGIKTLPSDKMILNGSVVPKPDNQLYQDGLIDLTELKNRKINQLQYKEVEIISAGFQYDVSVISSNTFPTGTMKVFDCTFPARNKIETLLNYGTFPFDWLTHRDYGREVITMTQTEMATFYSAMLDYVTPIKQYLYTSESQILNGTDTFVLNFDPNTGWP